MIPLEQTKVSFFCLGSPSILVTFPPASVINNLPAVEPRLCVDFKFIIASIFPLATQDETHADDPTILTPRDKEVSFSITFIVLAIS